MSIVGTRFTEKGRNGGTYEVVGAFEGGYVLSRVDLFEAPEHVTAADLAQRFGAEVDEPEPVDEQNGWSALADAHRAADAADAAQAETPEQVIARKVGLDRSDEDRLGHRRGS